VLLPHLCASSARVRRHIRLDGGRNTGTANVKFQASGWGIRVPVGQKWLQISIDADKVDKELPAEALCSIPVPGSSRGSYEIWNRIGYEFVRSPFECELTTAHVQDHTGPADTDLMELQDWNEVAWLKMGLSASRRERIGYSSGFPKQGR